MQTVLFIDGENFLHKISEVFKQEKAKKPTSDEIGLNLSKLLNKPLEGLSLDRRLFYAARLKVHPETVKKSQELIDNQRKLKNNLENQGFEFILAGNVRAQIVDSGKNKTVVFKEKGVDVRIAVDLVASACDGALKTAILCSSDSDLQPAVAELKKRKIEIIYLGFENNPNKGLTYTTDRTILFRNSEVLNCFNDK